MKSLCCSLVILLFVACAKTADTAATTDTTTGAVAADTATAAQATTDTAPPAASTATTAQETSMSAYENKVAVLQTTAGEIHIRFFPDVAPNHVKNFIDLANQGFYNGIKFHRIIPGFMIQGGDPNTISGNPNTWGMGGSPNKIRAEFNNIPHRRGIVSAARTQDPDSASSQFFIVVKDSNFLDNQYTVFGEVVKGMDVADTIVNAPKGANDRPNDPTSITKVVIRDAAEGEKGPAK